MIKDCLNITILSVTLLLYINHFARSGNSLKCGKRVDIDETWSVHSYDGDYNPIHDHGTKTLMGYLLQLGLKCLQIGCKIYSKYTYYSLYNESGHSDGCIAFSIWSSICS